LVSSFVLLGIKGAVPQWLVVLVLSRDLIIVFGYLLIFLVHQKTMTVDPTRLGKVNTFFELFTVGFVLMRLARPHLPLGLVVEMIQYITALTAAASGIDYVYRGLLWHQRQVSA
jgi:cardiolipin synthase